MADGFCGFAPRRGGAAQFIWEKAKKFSETLTGFGIQPLDTDEVKRYKRRRGWKCLWHWKRLELFSSDTKIPEFVYETIMRINGLSSRFELFVETAAVSSQQVSFLCAEYGWAKCYLEAWDESEYSLREMFGREGN